MQGTLAATADEHNHFILTCISSSLLFRRWPSASAGEGRCPQR